MVDSYEDEAVGHLEKNANGKFAVTRVDLHPKIAFSGVKQPTAEDLDALHEKAHKECFIANSVLTDVKVVKP
ncbi:OsmC-like protein [compost metagenome]